MAQVPCKCLVVGAGMAGLTAAHMLTDLGWQVEVAEKSRGIGGRLASRHTDYGFIDHGAPYLQAVHPPMRALMTGLANQGTVLEWLPTGKDYDGEWHIGVGGMSRMLVPLSDRLTIRFNTTITRVEPTDDGVVVGGTSGGLNEENRYDRVIISAPAPQALRLVERLGDPFSRLAQVSFKPGYTGLYVFAGRVDAGADVLRGDGRVAMAHRCNTKPPANDDDLKDFDAYDRWAVHLSDDYSKQVLETDKEDMAEPIADLFAGFAGASLPQFRYCRAHRWRYSRVERPLGEPYLLGAGRKIAVIGDGMLGANAEHAFESAHALVDYFKRLPAA